MHFIETVHILYHYNTYNFDGPCIGILSYYSSYPSKLRYDALIHDINTALGMETDVTTSMVKKPSAVDDLIGLLICHYMVSEMRV